MPELESRLRRAIEGGLRSVMLREKDLGTDDLVAFGLPLRRLCEQRGVVFLVNHDVEAAVRLCADGVHLGGRSRAAAEVRAMMEPGVLVGRSTHDDAELTRAQDEGVDYVTFGPVFDTPSKRGILRPRGLDGLKHAVSHTSVPVLGLGGISVDRAPDVRATGAFGIAAIRAVLGAHDPAAAAVALSRGPEVRA